MKRHDIENSIYRSWTFLERLKLEETFANCSVLDVNEEFRNLALSSDTAYVKLYLYGLNISYYNFLLIDFSYFQFSWKTEDDVRFVFYPNPFVKDSNSVEKFKKYDRLLKSGDIDIEEYYMLLDETKPEMKIPLIRYENSPSQHDKLRHPCSHFHIGLHADNRWAVRRILTPFAFTMFIVKQYFQSEWRKEDIFQDNNFKNNDLEDMLIKERKNCKELSDEFFTDIETQSFYFN